MSVNERPIVSDGAVVLMLVAASGMTTIAVFVAVATWLLSSCK